MTATSSSQSIAGEYYLRGVTEVGSGFLLQDDSTFQFFFSYGALDRSGSGKWERKGDRIFFNSRPAPPRDFALLTSRKTTASGITIKITDANDLLPRYVMASLKTADTTLEAEANDEGVIHFPGRLHGSLSLVFRFCPEKVSVFALDDKADYFEFRFEPWIGEYFFNNLSLRLEDKTLVGRHPLLDDKEYRFQKSGQ